MNENSTTPAESSLLVGISKEKRLEEGVTARKSCYELAIASSGQLVREYDVNTGDLKWGDTQGATQTQKGMQQVDQAAQNLNDLAGRLTSIARTYKVG